MSTPSSLLSPRLLLSALTGLTLMATACGDDASDNDDAAPQDVTLRFQGMVGDESFACGQTYAGMGTTDTDVEFHDFKVYVSEVALVTADGAKVPVELAQDGMWQHENVALLDFEDKTGGCANGTAELNDTVVGQVPDGDYTGVEFVVGVPFELNHDDVATAPAPLNLSSMYWSWAAGYKFLRVDGQTGDTAGFQLHLGSTACEGEQGNVSGCSNPNRIQVSLDDFDPAQDVIAIDAGQLLADLDLSTKESGEAAVCMSFPDHTDCEQVFDKYGLSFGSVEAGVQTFVTKK
ncbi:MbnP family copper-binding protein [Persicimonas caeni]|nr:MbnP family copper-binding protein [Persicimonas caeni]